MTTVDLATPASAFAIGAHPDDIEFGCGATLAKWAADGCAVTLLVCTDGSRGSWNAEDSQSALISTRHQEQRQAAARLGVRNEVVFLDEPDGELHAQPRLRTEIARWIRRLRPDVVLGHDPWKRYRLHPDHHQAGMLVIDGIIAAREPLYQPSIDGEPFRPSTLLLFEAQEIDHLEQIANTFDTKIAALTAHHSQLVSTMSVAPEEIDRLDDSPTYKHFVDGIRSTHEQLGNDAGIQLAEAFKRIDEL